MGQPIPTPIFKIKDTRGSLNQLLKRGLILHVTERNEFFSVIEYNPIPSERKIPKNHRIPQKRVYTQ